jgi:hypothetical protein
VTHPYDGRSQDPWRPQPDADWEARVPQPVPPAGPWPPSGDPWAASGQPPGQATGQPPSGDPWAVSGRPPGWPGHGYPVPGGWPLWAQPAPPVRKRRWPVIAGIVVGVVLVVGVLVSVVVGGYRLGGSAGASAFGGGLPAPTTSPPSPAAGLGDDAGLDVYAQRCHEGEMDACDDLYQLSETLSDYEAYGMTCGGRVKPFDVTWCTDLD